MMLIFNCHILALVVLKQLVQCASKYSRLPLKNWIGTCDLMGWLTITYNIKILKWIFILQGEYKEIPHFESSHEIQLLNNYVHTWSWPGLHFLYQHALLLTSHKLTVTQTDQLLTQKQLLELTASSLQQCREISHPQGCQIIHLSSCSSSSCTSQGSSARLFEFSSSVMLLCCPSHCIFILRHQKITVSHKCDTHMCIA